MVRQRHKLIVVKIWLKTVVVDRRIGHSVRLHIRWIIGIAEWRLLMLVLLFVKLSHICHTKSISYYCVQFFCLKWNNNFFYFGKKKEKRKKEKRFEIDKGYIYKMVSMLDSEILLVMSFLRPANNSGIMMIILDMTSILPRSQPPSLLLILVCPNYGTHVSDARFWFSQWMMKIRIIGTHTHSLSFPSSSVMKRNAIICITMCVKNTWVVRS